MRTAVQRKLADEKSQRALHYTQRKPVHQFLGLYHELGTGIGPAFNIKPTQTVL